MTWRYHGNELHAISDASSFRIYRDQECLTTVTGLDAEQVAWMCADLLTRNSPERCRNDIERLLAWKVGGNAAYLAGHLPPVRRRDEPQP
jgi:hypothetical protein